MGSRYSRRIAAWAVFTIGFFLMLLGVVLPLRTATGITRVSVTLSLLFLIMGSLFAIFAVRLSKRPSYVFMTSFVLMVGFFVFLASVKVIPWDILFKAWPLISVFSGFALIPAGWRHYNRFCSTFVVPACFFIVLGLVLLVFSFDVVTFSFRQFIYNWWPLLIALIGIIMVLVSLGARNSPGEQGK